ncbi:MAG TPA: FkbM family methyltransferase [Gallionella sp.]|nr:FkbM family methyltransferase [Gallionella sp.]
MGIKKAVKQLVKGLTGGKQAESAQGWSPLQVYPGYEDDDFRTIRKFATRTASTAANHYMDGFGVKTLYECVPFAKPETLNTGRLEFPVPDDGFHAEAIEYVALTDALGRARLGDSFCAVEIGAGWGPWMAAAGVIARQEGCRNIKLVGVEASSRRFPLMRLHLETNDLRPAGVSGEDAQHGNVFTRIFNGAVWTHDGEIWFPESDVSDMGAAATSSNDTTDYRGAKYANQAIPCKRLDTLLQDLGGTVDFMHIDIQGAELELLENQIEWVSNNVRTLMIATHSRPIEGKLMELLLAHGWQMYREKPCRVDWGRDCSLVGRTIVDGSQYWLNSKF